MRASILLTEDRPEARNLYEKVLLGFDFDVIACSGLIDAKEAVKDSGRVDGLWMDLNLEGRPGDYRNTSVIDGLDLIHWANLVSQGIPTLICSAFITEDAKEKAQRLQVYHRIAGWHSKPFDAELVGFDMVRAVNISFWQREVLPEMEKDLIGRSAELVAVRRNVIRTSNPYKLLFPRNRKHFERKLLGKMNELFADVEARARQNDDDAAHRFQAWAFTLTAQHLPACFETAGRNHQVLAEHLIYITEAFEMKPLPADGARQLKLAAEELGHEDLSEDTVFEIKSSLRQTLGAPIGPVMGSSREEVMRYFFGLDNKEK